MRRKDREITLERALQIVDICSFATVSMIDPAGNPYSVPLNIVRAENIIYFHSAIAGLKTECLIKNPAVCLSCVGKVSVPENKFTTFYESATVRGTATEVISIDEKLLALRLLSERHVPKNMQNFASEIQSGLPHLTVWKITITSVSGKANDNL